MAIYEPAPRDAAHMNWSSSLAAEIQCARHQWLASRACINRGLRAGCAALSPAPPQTSAVVADSGRYPPASPVSKPAAAEPSPAASAKPTAAPAASPVLPASVASPSAAARPASGGPIGDWQWQSTQPANRAAIVAGDPSRYTITFRQDSAVQVRASFWPSLNRTASYAVTGSNLELGLSSGGRMLLTASPRLELVGSVWQLLAYNNGRGGLQSVLDGTQQNAIFEAAGIVTGSGGCNTFSAPFQNSISTLSIGPVASTRMSCEQPIMDQETAYFAALERTSAYRFESGRLVLVERDGARQAEFNP